MGRSERTRRTCSRAAQLSGNAVKQRLADLLAGWLADWLADLVVLDLSEVEQTVDLELVAIEALGVIKYSSLVGM